MTDLTIKDVRAKFPQYSDLDDDQLANALHKKYYADLPRDDFYAKIGLGQSAPEVLESPRPQTRDPIITALAQASGSAIQPVSASGAGTVDLATPLAPQVNTSPRPQPNPMTALVEAMALPKGPVGMVGPVPTPQGRMAMPPAPPPSAPIRGATLAPGPVQGVQDPLLAALMGQDVQSNGLVVPPAQPSPYDPLSSALLTELGNTPERIQRGWQGNKLMTAEIGIKDAMAGIGQVKDVPGQLAAIRAKKADLESQLATADGLARPSLQAEIKALADQEAVYAGYGSEDGIAAEAADANRARLERAQRARSSAQTEIDRLNAEIMPTNPAPGLQEAIVSGVASFGDMAPGLISTLVTRNPLPMMIYLTGYSRGSSYADKRGAGVLPQEAMTAANLYAVAEAIPEYVPLMKILEKGTKPLAKIVGATIAEGASEVVTQGLQQLIDMGVLDRNMTWGEAATEMGKAGAAGGVMGALSGGGGVVADGAFTLADRRKAAKGTPADPTAYPPTVAAPVAAPPEAEQQLAAAAPQPVAGPAGQPMAPPAPEQQPVASAPIPAQPAPAQAEPITQEQIDANPDRFEVVEESEGQGSDWRPTGGQVVLDKETGQVHPLAVTAPAQAASAPVAPQEAGQQPQAEIAPDVGSSAPPAADSIAAPASQPAEVDSTTGKPPASWVIRNKETGEVVLETSDKAKVNALNTAKYEAVPIGDYLVSINGQAKPVEPAMEPTPQQDVVKPKPAPTAEIPHRTIKRDVAKTPTGNAVDVEYAIVELDDLTPSNFDDGRINPKYPQERQPRDRTKGGSEQQIQRILRDFDPRLLDESPTTDNGAPIVDAAGIVESGNGRAMMFSRMYRDRPDLARAYQDHLRGKYDISGVKKPVLVRIRRTDMTAEEIAGYTRDSNTDTKLSMSATEQALSDAAALPDSALALYRGGDIDAAANREFVTAFNRAVVPENEHATMIDGKTGAMSQEAVRRISGAMLAKAYGDADLISKLIEAADNNIKSIGGALLDVSPAWAKMRAAARGGTIAPEMDQTAALIEAVKLVNRARTEGRNVIEYVKQPDLLSGEGISPMGQRFLALMFRDVRQWTRPNGRDRMVQGFGFYVDEAMKTAPGADMFGGSADPDKTLELAKVKQDAADQPEGQQTDLFAAKAPGRDGGGVRPPAGDGTGTGPAKPTAQGGTVSPQGSQPTAVKPQGASWLGSKTGDLLTNGDYVALRGIRLRWQADGLAVVLGGRVLLDAKPSTWGVTVSRPIGKAEVDAAVAKVKAQRETPIDLSPEVAPAPSPFADAGFHLGADGHTWVLEGIRGERDGAWFIRAHPGDRFKVLRRTNQVGTVAVPTREVGIFGSAAEAIAAVKADGGKPASTGQFDASPTTYPTTLEAVAMKPRPGEGRMTHIYAEYRGKRYYLAGVHGAPGAAIGEWHKTYPQEGVRILTTDRADLTSINGQTDELEAAIAEHESKAKAQTGSDYLAASRNAIAHYTAPTDRPVAGNTDLLTPGAYQADPAFFDAMAKADMPKRQKLAAAKILAMGKKTGMEHLIALNADGEILAFCSGSKNSVSFSDAALAAIKAGEVAYSVHNHPSSRGASQNDMNSLWLGMPNLKIMGHNGSEHLLNIAPAAKSLTQEQAMLAWSGMENMLSIRFQEEHAKLHSRANTAEGRAAAIAHMDVLNANHANVVMVAFARAGLITYEGTADADLAKAGVNVDDYLSELFKAADLGLRRTGFVLPEVGNQGGNSGTESVQPATGGRSGRGGQADSGTGGDAADGDRAGGRPDQDTVGKTPARKPATTGNAAIDGALDDFFGTEAEDVQRPGERVERDSGDAGTSDRLGATDVPAAAGSDGPRGGKRTATGKAGNRKRSGSGRLPGDDAAPVGSGSNLQLAGRDGADTGQPADDRDGGSGDGNRTGGLHAGPGGIQNPAANADSGTPRVKITPAERLAAIRAMINEETADFVTRGMAEDTAQTIDQRKYTTLESLFVDALEGADINRMSDRQLYGAIIKPLVEVGMTRDEVARLLPYLETFYTNLKSGRVNLTPEVVPPAPPIQSDDRGAKQAKADRTKPVAADEANIRATLPLLLPEQQDDVLKVERRYMKPDGHGMMVTNGTGTGKSYSGGGVIKRFVQMGKGNVLIVAPSDAVMDGWRKTLEALAVPVSQLKNTKEAGKGVVMTTYANLRDNMALAGRSWDLVVTDESQNLMAAANGQATGALRNLRAITHRPEDLMHKSNMIHAEEWARLKNMRDGEAKTAEYRRLEAIAKAEVAKWQQEPRSKVLFLSATPFAYDKTVDYAEGYLFSYPKDGHVGNSRQSGANLFMVENFGYRIRYHKLTKPEAAVDSAVFERQFHEKLVRDGVLTGRSLQVDVDYDRKFVAAQDAEGNQLDKALEALDALVRAESDGVQAAYKSGNIRGLQADRVFAALRQHMTKNFDYLARMQLLESIKARIAAEDIKKHLALGRKVVVFHDFNVGGGMNPFTYLKMRDVVINQETGETDRVPVSPMTAEAAEGYRQLVALNPWIADLNFSGYRAPIEHLPAALGKTVRLFNGTIPTKQRLKNLADFNKDGSGVDVLVVQADAGGAGISMHDLSGSHQRVLINLGMPTKPTTTLQEEGRILRVGTRTNAPFRYYTIGTAWERQAFASRIAERSGTVENLALGNAARDLLNGFIDAYEEADVLEPGPNDGTGGKERDRRAATASPYEVAKTHYFGRMKTSGKRDQREGLDFYPTPEPLGLKMVEWGGVRPNERVLEPSAGDGSIARYVPDYADLTMIEPSSDLASRAQLRASQGKMIESTFESYHLVNKAHVILMNPPFGSGGKMAMDHLAKAAKHLRTGGRIVALIPSGPSADKRFNSWLDSDEFNGFNWVADISLPAVAFERAGTTVMSHVVIIDKVSDIAEMKPTQRINFTGAQDIKTFFDRLEQFGVPSRPAPKMDVLDELEAEGQDATTPMPTERPAAPLAPDVGGSSAFKTGETIHAKTGQQLFVATIKEKVEREAYDAINAVAKAHGGYYSSFRGNGAIPGFQFKSEADRRAFLDDMQKPTVGMAETVYHGSPHDHDGFSTDKIGTGEGFLAYGWGLYFAGEKEVARHYRDKLTVATLKLNGKDLPASLKSNYLSADIVREIEAILYDDPAQQPNDVADDIWQAAKTLVPYSLHRLASALKDKISGSPNENPQSRLATYREMAAATYNVATKAKNWPAAQEAAASMGAIDWLSARVSVQNRGRLYTVDVPDSADLLQWDKPLSKQSAKVKEAIRSMDSVDDSVWREWTGQQFYESLVMEQSLLGARNTQAKYIASNKLKDAGIPGLRYPDGLSRGIFEKKTYNYVIFDDSRVSILSKEQRTPPQLVREAASATEEIARLMPSLRAELDRLDLKRVRLASDAGADWQGRFQITGDGGMEIVIGASLDPVKTLHHEVIHALRAMNLFTELEWAALSTAAGKSWVAKHDIAARYPDLLPSEQIEEAIAEEFSEALAAKKSPKGSALVTAFNKIARIFRAIRTVLTGKGYDTPESIFGAVLSGEIGGRQAGNTGAMAGVAWQQRKGSADTGMNDLFAQPVDEKPASMTAAQRREMEVRMAQSKIRKVGGNSGDAGPLFDTQTDMFGQRTMFQRHAVRPLSPQARAHRNSGMQGALFIPDRRVWEELTRAGQPIWDRLRGAAGGAHDAIDAARQKIQDRFLPVLRAQEAVMRATGQAVDNDHNAYAAETTFSGKVGRHLFEIDEDFTKPIIDIIAATKGTLTVEDVGAWLYARHAEERNARIASINPQMPDGGSGMTDAEAQQIMADAAASPHAARLAEIGRLIDELRERSLKIREDAGLITPADANVWRAMYKHYVPLKGWAETDHSGAVLDVSGIGKRFNTRGGESKRAMGRESEAFNPLQAAITQAQEAAIRAEKNRVGVALYELARDFPAKALWEVKKPAQKRYFNRTTGLVETRVEDPVSMILEPNEMAVKVAGKEHRILFHDERLARAAGTVGADQMGWFIAMMSRAGRWFSMVNTMLDPEFVIRNAFRDITAAELNIRDFGKDDRNAVAKAMLRDWPRAFRAAFRGQKNKADTEWTKWYREFERAGARVSFWTMEQPEAAKSDLKRRIYLAQKGIGPRMASLLRISDRDNPVLSFIERTNMAVDNAVRLAAYVAVRKKGWSQQDAAVLAKNLTVNFNRRGEWGPTVNALYVFANASIQGSQTMLRVMSNKRMYKYYVAMVTLGIILDQINAAMSLEDDDGELAYDKIPDFKNQTNLVVMLGNESEKAATIWMPYGYNLFPYLGQQVSKVARGVKSPDDALADLGVAILGSFSPLGSGSVQQVLTPTMLDPVNEMAMNEDWLGRPIRPENEYADYGPDAYKFFSGASTAARATASMLNRATGGTEAEAGVIDVSPEYLDHAFGFVAGGAGRFVGRSVDILAKAASGTIDEVDPNSIPFYRSVIYDTSDWLDRDRYYRFRDRVKEAHFAAKKYADLGVSVPARVKALDDLYQDMLAADRGLKKTKGDDAAQHVEIMRFNRTFIKAMGRQGE